MPKGWSNLKTHKIPHKIPLNWPYSSIDTQPPKIRAYLPTRQDPLPVELLWRPYFHGPLFYQKTGIFHTPCRPPVHPLN